jgi:hypothetical protein
MEEASTFAHQHCRLWSRQLRGLPHPSSIGEYQLTLGKHLSDAQVSLIAATTFGGIPDFSIVLGSYWDVANREQRQRFNQLFGEYLATQFSPSAADSSHDCELEISLTQRDLIKEAAGGFVDLPAPRLLQALVKTSLQGVPLSYYLKQEPAGWMLVEITLNNTPLAAHYGTMMQHIIASHGFDAFFRWLKSPPE